jgi:hypothetical protein
VTAAPGPLGEPRHLHRHVQRRRVRTTFPPPVTTNAADIIALVSPRMDAIYIGSEPVSALNSTNDQLNRLFDVVSK